MATEDRKALGHGGIWLADAFQQALVQSLEAMTTEQPALEWVLVPSSGWGEPGNLSWWEQPISASKKSLLWLGVQEETWKAIGKLALAAAGIDDATPEDCLSTWKEISSQALSSAASAFGKRIRKEVNCEAGKDISASPGFEVCIALSISFKNSGSYLVRLGWNHDVQTLLDPGPEPRQEPELRRGAPGTATTGKSAGPSVENSRTLSLLLEVELPVSVSFGRAQLPLKDVLKLNSGSIVELNRAIAEPVEIIVNNCVIARGEVVVVEGNYGVRIKQIISKEERLRTLY